MAKAIKPRKKRKAELDDETDIYFLSSNKDLEFVSSGCTMLDNILGGGYVLGRMTNIIGDKSTAKTALATEAIINFCRQYEDGVAAYREIESAFDIKYAQAMGMPVDRVDLGEEQLDTVEDMYRDLDAFLDARLQDRQPGIYVVDSLDALSDEEEMKRDIDKGTYGANKQKKLGEIFRKLVRKLEKCRVLLIIISQVRDNIGVTFGEKHRRSGGKALDFYASQFLWLSAGKKLTKTIKKVERTYGVEIHAMCKKNKVGFPFRKCTFQFIFGYGVDDLGASLEFLRSVNRLEVLNINSDRELKEYLKETDSLDDDAYAKRCRIVSKKTKRVWNEIETTFLPKRRKYG